MVFFLGDKIKANAPQKNTFNVKFSVVKITSQTNIKITISNG
jgi:hypothetical protein